MVETDSTSRRPSRADLPQPPHLPENATPDEFRRWEAEAREFWMTHDSSPYWDQMEDVTDSPPPNLKRRAPGARSTARRRPAPDATKELTVRLSAEVVAVMRAKARVAGIPLDELVNGWLRDRMQEEFRQAMEAVK